MSPVAAQAGTPASAGYGTCIIDGSGTFLVSEIV